jgi:urease accessory protein
MKFSRRFSFFCMLATCAGGAFAHPGHGAPAGFMAGLVHPLGGVDHLLAMVAVGLWSAAALPAAHRWWGPASFAGAMLLGAVLAAAGASLPALEPGIAATVVLLGLLLAVPARFGGVAGAAIVMAAGLAHGLAHGMEAPPAALFAAYVAGFTLSTLALHAAGLAAGGRMRQWPASFWRAMGAAVTLAGSALLAARI